MGAGGGHRETLVPDPEPIRGPGDTLKWEEAQARDLSSWVSPPRQEPAQPRHHWELPVPRPGMEDGAAGQQGGPPAPGLCPHPWGAEGGCNQGGQLPSTW